jgi:hypothetical protein
VKGVWNAFVKGRTGALGWSKRILSLCFAFGFDTEFSHSFGLVYIERGLDSIMGVTAESLN